MQQLKYVTAIVIASILLALPMFGCSSQKHSELDLSNVRQIAKLATLECTYHSVARYGNGANEMPINPGRIGYKKYWFEYDAQVEVGVDATKIEFVSVPEGDGTVKVTMPDAEILTQPNIIETSMTDPITETGFVTVITDDDKKKALEDAQQEIRNKANGDDSLKFQAKERAKDVVEQYVKNIGNELGRKYAVEFINPEEKGIVDLTNNDSTQTEDQQNTQDDQPSESEQAE